jgi:hypothetical protein
MPPLFHPAFFMSTGRYGWKAVHMGSSYEVFRPMSFGVGVSEMESASMNGGEDSIVSGAFPTRELEAIQLSPCSSDHFP